ncbi:ROK family protein [Bacillus aerolatus]|uniref:ROK family protein n=1 Tax=Bacillus aerolatus TaxID=2653354 RepID=A0A6I1FT86_9BACI|nr:ROK family transcriptional regulator [Bacillus aerolatus]KAB7705518.1 ROK family protein [Bacillus aerolatus]
MIKQFAGVLSPKEKSLKELYSLITEHGPISRIDLVKYTRLKQTTCSRLIDELIENGLVIESGYGQSSGGRKPVMYEIKADAYYVIGIDISRTYTKVLLLNLSFSIIDEATLTMDEKTTPDVTIEFIASRTKTMMERRGLASDDVLGAGIGAIGPLDRENGIILNPIYFSSPGWENVPLCSILSEKLNIKTVLEYGANTATLAEYQQDSFKKYRNVVSILKGVGIRNGLIIDGRLVQGADKLGAFGQGHMVVDVHGRKCVCGGYGCIHAYSSIPAIQEEVVKGLKRGYPSILREWRTNIEEINFDDICRAVNEGDSFAEGIIKDAAYYSGIGLANLVHMFFPDLIILGGPLYTKMDLYYNVVTEIATNRSKVIYPEHEIIFSKGLLGENAGAIGAGRAMLNYYLTDQNTIY